MKSRMKPRVARDGGYWVVWRLNQGTWGKTPTFNSCFDTWWEALDNALRFPLNGFGR
jgi:hypothetical protein